MTMADVLQDGNSTLAVHELSMDEYKASVLRKGRPYNVVVWFNLPEDEHEDKCPRRCHWLDKQITEFANAFTKQYQGGDVYNPLKAETKFIRVAVPSNSPQKNEVPQIPTLGILKARSNSIAYFGSGPLSDTKDEKRRKPSKEERDALDARLKSKQRSVKRAADRARRRRGRVTTQEEEEYPSWGQRDYWDVTMNNICKWVTLKLKQELTTCPQDVDRNIEDKAKPSEILKNVLIGGVGLSVIVYVARTFDLLKRSHPSQNDLQAAVCLQRGIAQGEQHCMHQLKNRVWRFLTVLGFLVCMVAASCCSSGMYWNILNGQSFHGNNVKPPLTYITGLRKELPMEAFVLASSSTMATLSLLAVARSATLRGTIVKLSLSLVAFATWIGVLLFLLGLFTQRNQYYLGEHWMKGYVDQLLFGSKGRR